MSRLVLGYASTCYGTRRVSHDLPMAAHEICYRRVQRLPWHRLPFTPARWTNRYSFFPGRTLDAVHLFNGICVSPIPWISSIELEYPRYFGHVPDAALREAVEMMASDYCRLLLPMSEAARQRLLHSPDSDLRAVIQKKAVVFTGGVSIPKIALDIRERHLSSTRKSLNVGFVGRAFWHKGGAAVLEAVSRLRARGADIRLLVVSELRSESYVMNIDEREVEQTRALLSRTSWIEHHHALPNEDVLIKMAGCDIFAFPSFDESLGWVAIEALGLGIPIVSSNVFALPEINENGVTGYTIPLPLDSDRRWIGIPGLSPEPRPTYQDTIADLANGCERAFEKLLGNRSLIEQMGIAARRAFLDRYAEHVAAQKLSTLIRRAL